MGLNFQISWVPLIVLAVGMIFYALLYDISDEQAKLNKEKLIEMDFSLYNIKSLFFDYIL